jgi:hypothetical protein
LSSLITTGAMPVPTSGAPNEAPATAQGVSGGG